MKKLSQIAVSIVFLGLAVFQAQAFTSMYIFGDGLSATANNSDAGQYYYGLRNSNGRVWVEVLAQRLGLGANSITNPVWSNSGNNYSYYGQYSPTVIQNLNSFARPADAGTALFVVWVNNADFVNDISAIFESQKGGDVNSAQWTAAINQSLANHWSIITNLYYAKGARTIIMPSAVDLTEIPEFDAIQENSPSDRNFIRQQIINFNIQFAALLSQAQASLPGLTIYEPDYFSLLDNVLANPSSYGLVNALYDGVSIDAIEDPNLSNAALNGPGAYYIFWDATDPSAKLHEIMADIAQQMVAPVKISQVTVFGQSTASSTTNQLAIANMPVGLNGFVDGTTNMGRANWTWTTVTNISSVSTAQSIFVTAPPLPQIDLPSGDGSIYPGSAGGAGMPPNNGTGASTNSVSLGAVQVYRLRFPYAWNWP